jgi:Putative rhamnosyl transferase
MKIMQFLLTRFNPAVGYAAEDTGIDSAWLSQRFKLFEGFCLPSVAGQSEKDFHWILLVSDRTPREWLARLLADVELVSSPVSILMIDLYSEKFFVSAMRERLERKVERVVSTRLDNDDAIARDYLAEVRVEADHLPRDGDFVINFKQGCQVARAGIFPRVARMNPFLSLVSSPRNLKSAYSVHHERMGCVGKVVDKSSGRAQWLQVIHPRNAASRLRPESRRPCSEAYLDNFSLGRNWQSCL